MRRPTRTSSPGTVLGLCFAVLAHPVWAEELLYVAEAGTRVAVLTDRNEDLRADLIRGVLDEGFDAAVEIAVGPLGRLFVADFEARRVVAYADDDGDGTPDAASRVDVELPFTDVDGLVALRSAETGAGVLAASSFGGRKRSELALLPVLGAGGIVALGEPVPVDTTLGAAVDLVSPGPGRVWILDPARAELRDLRLLDDDGDGVPERSAVRVLAPASPSLVALAAGPDGELFTLDCGRPVVEVLADRDGDGRADGPAETLVDLAAFFPALTIPCTPGNGLAYSGRDLLFVASPDTGAIVLLELDRTEDGAPVLASDPVVFAVRLDRPGALAILDTEAID